MINDFNKIPCNVIRVSKLPKEALIEIEMIGFKDPSFSYETLFFELSNTKVIIIKRDSDEKEID